MSLLALISVILIAWTLRGTVEGVLGCWYEHFDSKVPSHALVLFVFDFVTTRFASWQLGAVDEAMGVRYVFRGIHVP